MQLLSGHFYWGCEGVVLLKVRPALRKVNGFAQGQAIRQAGDKNGRRIAADTARSVTVVPGMVAIDGPFEAVALRVVYLDPQVYAVLCTVIILYFESEWRFLQLVFFPGHMLCFCQVIRLNKLWCEGWNKRRLLAGKHREKGQGQNNDCKKAAEGDSVIHHD